MREELLKAVGLVGLKQQILKETGIEEEVFQFIENLIETKKQ